MAVTFDINLNHEGFRVGPLDLEFASSSTHLILGVKNLLPEENRKMDMHAL